MNKQKNIFDKARDKIHKEYSSRPDYCLEDVKKEEDIKIWHIDCAEETASKSIKNAFTNRIEVAWSIFTENEKNIIISDFAILGFLILFFLYNVRDIPLNFLILDISEFCFVVTCAMIIYCIYRLLRKKFIKNIVLYMSIILFLVLSVPYFPVLCGHSSTQIGDFYEVKEYSEKYYVLMSKQPEISSKRTVYKLPAKIIREYCYESTSNKLEYHINYLFFQNGGSLYFDTDNSDTHILPNKETKCMDSKGDIYYVTLTKEKAK